jgi:two-component system sensor kinase FixL
MAANFNRRGDVLLVSAGCTLLSILSYFLSHGIAFIEAPLVRAIMSLSAIGITTLLALKYQSATQVLHAQAQLLDLTHDTVLVRDMDDVITYWNRGAEELYGLTRKEAIGRVTSALLQTRLPEPPEEVLTELLRTDRWEGELVRTRRDGTKAVVASRWALKHDEHGRPQEILETNNDITAKKHAQEALAEAHVQLAHATRIATLGELTASIAHEVNQPLAGIITNGEAGLRWLTRAEPQLEEVQRAIERMISDGKRASQVVHRLRALARKAPTQMTLLDLNEVITETAALVQREILSHHIALHLELVADLPLVLGNRIELQQVVINLMVNGIQAMEPVLERPRDLVIRSSRHKNEEVVVLVQDSGIGINPDNMDRLFNAFFTTKPGRMGMGLSICRSIIDAHGGRLWASSNAGPGATFQFALPANA